MSINISQNRGFTLLEMIISMSIICILAGFGIMKYPGVQKSARDTQRRSDLKQYQTSLESYANIKGGFYPSRTGSTPASDVGGGTNLCSTDLGLSQCPADPKTGQSICGSGVCNYFYISDGTNDWKATAKVYVLYAILERELNSKYYYFVVCSNGATGTKDITTWTPGSVCPL
jgi:prepilin-type N-terminal cleavage/methylation domain-containing protein